MFVNVKFYIWVFYEISPPIIVKSFITLGKDLRQGGLFHRPVSLCGHDHLLHPGPDPEGRRSRTCPHVLAQDGELTQAHGLARCCNPGEIRWCKLFGSKTFNSDVILSTCKNIISVILSTL
jgi:hypothetical protein